MKAPAPGVTGWERRPPRSPLEDRGRLRAVVVHHTAISDPRLVVGPPSAELAYMRHLEALHLSRGWSTIGYHFVVMPSGRVHPGRPPDALGAHAAGHNRGTLGVALAGDFEAEAPTAEALAGLAQLLDGISISVPTVGHLDLDDATTCPGRHLYRLLPGLVRSRRKLQALAR